jgi:hypothetical protein
MAPSPNGEGAVSGVRPDGGRRAGAASVFEKAAQAPISRGMAERLEGASFNLAHALAAEL